MWFVPCFIFMMKIKQKRRSSNNKHIVTYIQYLKLKIFIPAPLLQENVADDRPSFPPLIMPDFTTYCRRKNRQKNCKGRRCCLGDRIYSIPRRTTDLVIYHQDILRKGWQRIGISGCPHPNNSNNICLYILSLSFLYALYVLSQMFQN